MVKCDLRPPNFYETTVVDESADYDERYTLSVPTLALLLVALVLLTWYAIGLTAVYQMSCIAGDTTCSSEDSATRLLAAEDPISFDSLWKFSDEAKSKGADLRCRCTKTNIAFSKFASISPKPIELCRLITSLFPDPFSSEGGPFYLRADPALGLEEGHYSAFDMAEVAFGSLWGFSAPPFTASDLKSLHAMCSDTQRQTYWFIDSFNESLMLSPELLSEQTIEGEVYSRVEPLQTLVAAQFASAQSSAGVWISGLSSNLLSKLGAANTLADIPARDNPLRYDTLESWNVANSTFAKRDEGVHFDKDVFGRTLRGEVVGNRLTVGADTPLGCDCARDWMCVNLNSMALNGRIACDDTRNLRLRDVKKFMEKEQNSGRTWSEVCHMHVFEEYNNVTIPAAECDSVNSWGELLALSFAEDDYNPLDPHLYGPADNEHRRTARRARRADRDRRAKTDLDSECMQPFSEWTTPNGKCAMGGPEGSWSDDELLRLAFALVNGFEYATLQEAIDHMLLEPGSVLDTMQVNYRQYFEECQPTVCSYVHTGRQSPEAILTNVLAWFSGVKEVLLLVVGAVFRPLLEA